MAGRFPLTSRSLSWSKQGYIYHNTIHELHRVKEDGSSHDIYTYGKILTRPVCSPDGELVLIEFTETSTNYDAILDKDGNFIDSIEQGLLILHSWIDNEHILYWYDGTYRIVNVYTKSVVETGELPTMALFGPLDDWNMLAIKGQGGEIHIYNRLANTTTLIKENCGDRYRYTTGSGAIGLNKIVSLRWKYHVIDSAAKKVSFSTDIVRMNLDSSDEEIVLLPE